MKVRSAIKSMCKDCYIVRRGKTRYVYCKSNAKHKQRQGYHTFAGDMCTMCITQQIISTSSSLSSLSSSSSIIPKTISSLPLPLSLSSISSKIFPTYESLSSSLSSSSSSSSSLPKSLPTLKSSLYNINMTKNINVNTSSFESIKVLGLSSLYY